jgi:error-prone DNA polymerase
MWNWPPPAACTGCGAPRRAGIEKVNTTEPAAPCAAGRAGDYVELHARSAFSFLRGASPPEALAEEAARRGLPAVALCDRDGVYGAPRFFGAARRRGVRAIVGAEVTLADGSVLPLLVESQAGYRNLCRLITVAKLEPRPAGGPEPEQFEPIDVRARKRPCLATGVELAAHAGGLVALTGDEEGPVRRAWARGGESAARAVLRGLVDHFGRDGVVVEVTRRLVRGEEAEVRGLLALAAAEGLPVVATGGGADAVRADREVADVFTCLRHQVTLDTAGRRLAVNNERHLRSGAAMRALWRERPEAVTHTARLAERLGFTLRDLGYRFPDYPVPPGETPASWLRVCTEAGARARWGTPGERHRAQLAKELALIERLGFCGYFLAVWDICRWCRERGILVQGRGSAANSAVCYALGITAVDPIRHRLLFERFLSEGRIGADGHPSWPDIDLDLPSGALREQVIQEVYRRHGPRGAAMTANVITYRGRSTARELGKVLDLPGEVLERFSALFAGGDFPHTLGLEEQLRQSGLPAGHPRLAAWQRLWGRVHGLPRHLGQHSGGMVLAAGQLDGVVPLEPATMPGRTVVQWDKDDCEELGIVKVDFLGLGMMAVLQDTFALCRERGRPGPHALHAVPPDDAATFAAMQRADTVGVFQIESRAQMTTLRRFRPESFYDVAIQVAIVRPGPIVGKVAHPLLRRRAGLEAPVCLDPSVHERMRPVLERTWGVILFQEQMLQVAMELAGFTATEAEELRRSMGFTRDQARLQRAMDRLCEAMRSRGHPEHLIRHVVESAGSFALYGFPEAHAVSFALLAYASTWLKVHRPAEFLAGLLNNQPMGFYSPATLVQDARRHGLRLRPPCVVRSQWRSTVEADDAVRLGLGQVKGLREAAVNEALGARAARAWGSLGDFLARTAFTAAERRALAASGALNAFAGHRRAALWQVEAAWEPDEELLRRFTREETGAGGVGAPLAPMTLGERIAADFAATGLTAGTHPMALARPHLPECWCAAELPLARDGDRVTIAGSVICRQRPGTAKGVVFVSLEDETGVANAIVSAELFERQRLVLNQETALRIRGRVQNREGVIHIKAERLAPLGVVADAAPPAQASHDFH